MRWTHNKKHSIITQIRKSVITFGEACAPHDLSREELERWFKRLFVGEKLLATKVSVEVKLEIIDDKFKKTRTA